MTPDAVIYRYLEIVTPSACDIDQLCLLLSADADLLTRWLKLLNTAADIDVLRNRITALEAEEFDGLAQAQAWAVLPIVGSARLSMDQWLAVLRAACLAQVLAEHLKQDSAATPTATSDLPGNPQNVRLRALLAISGVHLPTDPTLAQLIEFRGINPALLEDASAELRIFAVVDALEVGRELELAEQLLGIPAPLFAGLLEDAETAANTLVTSLAIDTLDEVDWAHRIWLRQQIATVTAGYRSCSNLNEFYLLHQLVSRCLFAQPPLLLVQANANSPLRQLGKTDIRTSRIAACVRTQHPSQINDSADLAVVDRQLLRSLDAEEAYIVPLASETTPTALIVALDEDNDIDAAAELYAQAITEHVERLHAPQIEDVGIEQNLLVEQFRTNEYKRLREIVHEANNPLSIVHNYLHILELRLQHEPEAVEQLELIASELRRAGDIFTRARDIPNQTSVEAPRTGEVSDINIGVWSARLAELHSGYAAEHGVPLHTRLPAQSVTVRTESDKLTQVISNLVKNAIEACAAGDEVLLGVRTGVYRDGIQGVEIFVEDSGPGLSEEVLADLAGVKVTHKGGDHQGVGLQVAFRLSAELGGALDVRTEQGQGTTFSLFLPRA